MDKKIKILYVSHSPFFNGAEICLLTLIRNINRDIFEPIVVFPHSGPLFDEMKKLGTKAYITPIERWIRYEYEKPVTNTDLQNRYQKIADIIKQESIDIVHTNSSVVLEGAIAAKVMNIPHVWHIHEYLIGHPELCSCLPVNIIYEVISYLSDKVIAVSNFVKKQFIPIISDDRVVTIYNGVEENKNSKGNDFIRKSLGIGEDEIIAVTIGMLIDAKGFDNLLKAASIVGEKGYKIKFLWAGGGSRKSIHSFNSKVKKLGLKNSVVYLGFRDDIPAILSSADLLICTSLMETLSLAVLEAMAAGLPVITTDCGGTSECVVDNLTGYIVPIDDPVKLSGSIIDLAKDGNKRKQLGTNGFSRYAEKFTAKLYAEQIEELYDGILSSHRKSSISEMEAILIEDFSRLCGNITRLQWNKL